MLFGIPAQLPAELLQVLASMGHGDEIALVDANYPAYSNAQSTYCGAPIELAGLDLPAATQDILTVLPLDTFDEAPAQAMAVPGNHKALPSVQQDVLEILKHIPGGPWPLTPLERFAFYERAKKAFVIVRTLERRPYGCVIFKKGVLSPTGELMSPELASAIE
ncbi:MAG: RbsD/FucU domain-containing protein [Granulosicoccus sp.]